MYSNEESENILRNQIDAELSKFNWAAFLLGIFWAIPNGAWKNYYPTFIIIIIVSLLTGIPLLGWIFCIVLLCLYIYVGKKGNEWAWYGSKKWGSVENFSLIQRNWAAASPIAFIVLLIVVPQIIALITALIVSPFAKKIIDQAEIVNKAAVKSIVSAPDYKKFRTSEDIALYLVNSGKYSVCFGKEPCVIADKKGPYYAVLTFTIDKDCSLDKQNCYVQYNVKTPKKLLPEKKTYFDDNGFTKN